MCVVSPDFLHQRLAAEDDAAVAREQIDDQLRAFMDLGLARVLIENLLGNAWKFTGKVAPSRIEFGIEDADDILWDLEQALARSQKSEAADLQPAKNGLGHSILSKAFGAPYQT